MCLYVSVKHLGSGRTVAVGRTSESWNGNVAGRIQNLYLCNMTHMRLLTQVTNVNVNNE